MERVSDKATQARSHRLAVKWHQALVDTAQSAALAAGQEQGAEGERLGHGMSPSCAALCYNSAASCGQICLSAL